MSNRSPLVSIVILNWNGLEDTKICLKYAKQIDYDNFEIIVVDNGSSANEKEYLSKLKGIKYVDNPLNRGFTGGHIDGLKYAAGDYIMLLNNDAVVKPDYLRKAIPIFLDKTVGAVGGKAFFWNDESPLMDEYNKFYSYQEIDPYTGEARSLQYDSGAIQEVNNVSGSAVIVSREAITSVGYLYEPFFAYFEETDLFARMKRAGYRVLYNPNLMIWHKNGASSGTSAGSYFFYYQIFRNRFIFAIRNFENKFLGKFLVNYFGVGFKSLFRTVAKPRVNQNMNRAYAKSSLVCIAKLPSLLFNRIELQHQLGKSRYNHILIKEQTGVSVIYDATKYPINKIQKLAKSLSDDSNPLHEYIIIVNASYEYSYKSFKSVRYITDREYFSAASINLGCLAARHQWLIIMNGISTSAINKYFKQLYRIAGTKFKVANLGTNSLLISKNYYQHIGGINHGKTLIENFDYILSYAAIDGQLGNNYRPKTVHSKEYINALKQDRQYNNRLSKRFIHVQQFLFVLRWWIMPSIPLRLKLARTKNLVLYSTTFNRRSLSMELKHIKNETTIYGGNSINLENRQELQAQALKRALKSPDKIPVFIICFERLDGLKKLVRWLELNGISKIIFIDNASTYPPLLDYYAKSNYQLLELGKNIGHTAPWALDIIRILTPQDYYVVTDPDVIPVASSKDHTILHLLDVHKKYPLHEKVGLGLKIDDLPRHYPLRKSVIEWESQFWKTSPEDDVYEAGVDTTFALYKPFTYDYKLHPSLRTGGIFVARHLPWYVDPNAPTLEEKYYRLRASSDITSWNVNELPDRYKKAMRK